MKKACCLNQGYHSSTKKRDGNKVISQTTRKSPPTKRKVIEAYKVHFQ